MAKTKRISVVLDTAMIRALRAAAKREGRPQATVVRAALASYLGVEDNVQYGFQAQQEEPEQELLAYATP